MSLGQILSKSSSSRPDAPNRNGSDQAVVIRTLGAPVEVTLAGKPYLVTGGSLRFHETLTRFQDSGKKKLQKRRDEEGKTLEPNQESFDSWKSVSDRVSALNKTIEAIEAQRETLGDTDYGGEKYEAAQRERKEAEIALQAKGDFAKVLEYVRDALEIKDRLVVSTNEHCLRLVQLILLNSQNPQWRKERDHIDTQGFPSQGMLDSVIPFDTLYDDAEVYELQNVIDVFAQINQPETFRKNALALTGIK